MSIDSEIKFHDVLRALIESSPYKRNRRPIWEAIGITSASLSQYVNGESRPRYEILLALARFFGVSVGYLLTGTEDDVQVSQDSKPFVKYVDWALADVQNRVAYHDWLVGKIGRRLASHIDSVAKELTTEEHFPGALTIDDQIVLEAYSHQTKVMCHDLDPDLILVDGGDIAVGRFMPVLASSLKRSSSRTYEFLLLPRRPQAYWEDLVHRIRRVLVSELGVSLDRLEMCKFRIDTNDSFTATVFYKLEVVAVQRHEPLLWDMLSPYVTTDGWMGFVPEPNKGMKADMLFSADRLAPAVSLFNQRWERASVIV